MVFEAHCMSFPCTELLLFNYANVNTVFHSMAPLKAFWGCNPHQLRSTDLWEMLQDPNWQHVLAVHNVSLLSVQCFTTILLDQNVQLPPTLICRASPGWEEWHHQTYTCLNSALARPNKPDKCLDSLYLRPNIVPETWIMCRDMPRQQLNTTIHTMHPPTVMQSYIILNTAVKTWILWLSSALRKSTKDITLLPL